MKKFLLSLIFIFSIILIAESHINDTPILEKSFSFGDITPYSFFANPSDSKSVTTPEQDSLIEDYEKFFLPPQLNSSTRLAAGCCPLTITFTATAQIVPLATATQSITVNGTVVIDPTKTVDFTAGTEIILNPGFDASPTLATAYFSASIAVCTGTAPQPQNAGPGFTTCSNPFVVSGANPVGNVEWISPTGGTFTKDNSYTWAPTYTPSAADIQAGKVTLTLQSRDVACAGASDQVTITFGKAATADIAGTQPTASSTTNKITLPFTATGGTPTFSPATGFTYDVTTTPGSVIVTSTATTSQTVDIILNVTPDAADCQAASDKVTVTFNAIPRTFTISPTNIL